ncbi:MAG TPA: GNAT family N-acetyltransferase [Ktedonobacterales bacterium]|nr:GNAT family N-acetyltransferase [Ktedonobacterales bacterium]
MDPTFRLAGEADLETIIPFMREFYAIDSYPFDEQAARRALDEFLAEPLFGRVWLIEVGAVPVGYVVLTLGYSLEFHGRDAFIDELFVAPSSRHQGIGKRAMQFVETACRELGVHALHLEVERHNTAAQQLYRQSGFEDHDRFLLSKWLRVAETKD